MSPLKLRGASGQTYQLSKVIGRGGEATVYRVAGRGDLLAKIFRKPDRDREQKLKWMIAYPPDDPAAGMGHTSISWPLEMVYRDARFSGYLMPNILDTVQILNVYHPRLRQQTFHAFTLQHLYNTAYNLAAALGAIHDRDYVVGDLNESNVLVARSTLVTLIDTDSFQVQAVDRFGRTRTHFCHVGKPEYLPPEMQGADLSKTIRAPEHDRFALAVLVYQLLMDGNHPFRARWTGKGDKPALPERIEMGLFPFSEAASTRVTPSSDMNRMHPLLVDLFKRCFILGHDSPSARPRPSEWEAALGEAAVSLVTCTNGHYRSPHLDRCPSCERPLPPARKPVRTPRKPGPDPKPRPRPSAAPSQAPAQVSTGRAAAGSSLPFSIPLPQFAGLPPSMGQAWRRSRRAVQRWVGSRQVQHFVLQPGLWAVIGFLAGAALSTQVPALTGARTAGAVGGLVSGALAGDVIEKKIGWETFLGVFGVIAGLLGWYLLGETAGVTGWILSGAIGGVLGMLVGRYGRFAQLTLLWAASGTIGGWFLGQGLAGAVSPDWLSGAFSLGMLSLITGLTYALWKRFV